MPGPTPRVPAYIAGAPLIPASVQQGKDKTTASYALPVSAMGMPDSILVNLGIEGELLYQAEFSANGYTQITEFYNGEGVMIYGGISPEIAVQQATNFRRFSPHPLLANVVFAYKSTKINELSQILADLGFVITAQTAKIAEVAENGSPVFGLGHFPRILIERLGALLKEKEILPQKSGIVEKINEEPLSHRVIKLGNIYYIFGWLGDQPNTVFFPDGEMKQVVIPMNSLEKLKFAWFIRRVRSKFKLESGADPLRWRFLPHTEIGYRKNGKTFKREKFPLVVVNVFLKHLEEFITLLTADGFIKSGSLKERRAIIMDAMQDAEGVSVYVGDEKRGFDVFWIGNIKTTGSEETKSSD